LPWIVGPVMEKDELGFSEIHLVVRTRSVFACFLHWILFVAVVTLVITGFYISWPNYYFGSGEAYQAFAMANMRYYHFIAATGMIVFILLRGYLAFTPSCNKDIKQFMPTPRNIVGAYRLAMYFLTWRGTHAEYRFVNPLGGIGVFMMVVCMLIQTATGFLMYLPGADVTTWWWAMGSFFERLLGGQQSIRLIHHVTMYALIFVVIIHVYMQIVKSSMFTEADIASIISGYKIFPISHIGHFADAYGLHLDEKAPSPKVLQKASRPMIEAVEKENGG